MASDPRPATAARHRRLPGWPALLGLATIGLAAVLMEWLVARRMLPPDVVARPSAVLLGIGGLLRDQGLIGRLLLSLGATLAAAALAAVSGVPLGWMLHRYRLFGEIFGNWMAALAAAPFILLYPLFLAAFGRGETTIVAMAYVSALVAVALKTREGLATVPAVLRAVGASLRLSRTQLFWKIEFPSAVPAIFTGIHLALVFALVNVIGVEFLIGYGGLGELVVEVADRHDVASVYAAVLVVVLVSAAFFWAMDRLERWFNPL